MVGMTVGEVARAAAVSEKAIRLYSEKGLLRPERTEGGARRFDAAQVQRARRVALLRRLDLPLADIAELLDAPDPVARFDALWSDRRADAAAHSIVAEHVRAALAGERSSLPTPEIRDVPERVVVTAMETATLRDLPAAIPELTERVFAHLIRHDAPLSGPPFVRYPQRATETFAVPIVLAVPVEGPVPPAVGISVEVDAAHREAFVPVTQGQARSQQYLVVLHDHLSSGGSTPGVEPVGDNRESYFPNFGGAADDDVVMEVAVPVR